LIAEVHQDTGAILISIMHNSSFMRWVRICEAQNSTKDHVLCVQVQSGRRLVPTPLGITLVRGYQVIDVDLCLPDIRSFIEKQITLIAKGQVEYTYVVRHVLKEFAAKFAYFVAQASFGS
jgi:hypothetical protein